MIKCRFTYHMQVTAYRAYVKVDGSAVRTTQLYVLLVLLDMSLNRAWFMEQWRWF